MEQEQTKKWQKFEQKLNEADMSELKEIIRYMALRIAKLSSDVEKAVLSIKIVGDADKRPKLPDNADEYQKQIYKNPKPAAGYTWIDTGPPTARYPLHDSTSNVYDGKKGQYSINDMMTYNNKREKARAKTLQKVVGSTSTHTFKDGDPIEF